MELIGWLGSMLLAFCGLPDTIKSILNKRCDVPWSLLIPWSVGEVLALVYMATKFGLNPLLWNYLLNVVLISVMLYYKIGDRK